MSLAKFVFRTAPETFSGPFSPLLPPEIAHYAARTENILPPVIVFGEFSLAGDEVYLQTDRLSERQQVEGRRLDFIIYRAVALKVSASINKATFSHDSSL